MMLISQIRRLQNLGGQPEEPHSFENRRILLLNKVTMMAMGLSFLIVIIHLILRNIEQAVVVSLTITFVCIPTLYFQSIKKYSIARYWFLTGLFILITTVFFHSIRLNLSTGTAYLLIMLIPMIIIFLDGASAFIVAIMVIACGNFYLAYRFNLSESAVQKVFYGIQINWIVISITVLFCVIFFKKSIFQANFLIERDRKKLDTANKTKNFLFAVISHDIRSPLSTLKQYLTLDPSLRSDPKQFMMYQGELAKKVDEINQTLDDLLFWSKSQLQGIINKPSAFSASEVIDSVMTLSEEIILNKGIKLRVDHHTQDQLWCDKDHLTIIIRNLVQNAIKFTSSGEALTIETSSEKDMVRISIADTGKGMDETTLNNLRDGLIVESHLGTAGEVGTGLGLSLVNEMISKNNGKLEVESQLGVGTKISVLIPKIK